VNGGAPHFTVRVTAAAEADFQEILRWNLAQFGEMPARASAETLADALGALTSGPSVLGATQRRDIAKGLLTLHVVRNGRNGSHIVLFRVGLDQDREVIEVLRLLQDAFSLKPAGAGGPVLGWRAAFDRGYPNHDPPPDRNGKPALTRSPASIKAALANLRQLLQK